MLTNDLPETTVNIAAATLTGDIRDFMLGQAKRNSKCWDDRSERDQQSFIDACNIAAEDVVRKAVKVVAARGFEAIEFTLGNTIKLKDGAITVEAKFDGSLDNLRAMMSGSRAVIVFARPIDFFGERQTVRAAPDQPDLMDKIDETEGSEALNKVANSSTGKRAADAADKLAAMQQKDALAGAGTNLGPEAKANADRLSGIKELKTSDTDPVGSDTSAPKRRGHKSAEERVASNAASVAQGAGASDQPSAR